MLAIWMLFALLFGHPSTSLAAADGPATTLVVGTIKADKYDRAGGRSGTPVIFIPSLGAGPWIWGGLDRRFASSHPVYTLTLAGLDGRPAASAPVIEKVVADLARLIVQQHLDRPVLIGHSLGGYIGYRFATEHPDLVGRLVAMEGFPVFPPLANADAATRRAAAQKLAGTFTEGGTPQAFLASMQGFLEARMNDSKEADRLATLASRSDPKAVAEYVLEMLPADLRPDLVKLKAPVLAIVAANSYRKGASESDIRAFYTGMLANAPQASVVIVPNARHFVMLDQPDAVYRSIRQFLQDTRTADAPHAPASDVSLIRQMLHDRFDNPDAPLTVGPIAVSGDAAIADWAQGATGGRALLRRRQGQWSIMLCGGEALKETATLVQAGLAMPQATVLANDLAAMERTLSPAVLARFGHFAGLVHMDAKQ
ncbi:hypothetical protein GQ56_0106740 [Burkholderia paludis]|uniref:copper uptake system-associated protein n=1 Tax=Burkholderia paludis TaxID=1506587 RepID=UPI0004DB5D4B|nr:copper uptake system-associated protein [Burkholderia paludis]KFG97975.1 hypothetical protein GQ56_0106740 [Burkholderia paludis]